MIYKENQFRHFKRRFGDRYDGWRVRNIDPVSRMVPYFLRTRMDSQNLYEEQLNLQHIEEFIKEHKSEMPELSIMHIIIASMVRLYSQRPYLNRFVIWNKLFSRNHLCVSIAIKRELTDKGEETLIKPYFNLDDTLYDVVRKLNQAIEEAKPEGTTNDVDKISRFLGVIPDFMMRIVVFLLRWTDKIGILPVALNKVSPWHSSIFLTNIGSIGVDSIYHHLYEFGTCSMFVAMGKKIRKHVLTKDGETVENKSIKLRFVMDERVCDGFYYASSMRQLNKIFANPKCLLEKPASIVTDDGVEKK